MAESTTGAMMSAEFASRPSDAGNPVTPEDVGKKAATMLLQEIFKVGFHTSFAFSSIVKQRIMVNCHLT